MTLTLEHLTEEDEASLRKCFQVFREIDDATGGFEASMQCYASGFQLTFHYTNRQEDASVAVRHGHAVEQSPRAFCHLIRKLLAIPDDPLSVLGELEGGPNGA